MSDKNQKRKVFKERAEQLCHLVNMSANEAKNFQEFVWLIQDRMKASALPESWQVAATNKQMINQFWNDFKDLGYCIKPDDLRALERELANQD